jgi:hypothetical protein
MFSPTDPVPPSFFWKIIYLSDSAMAILHIAHITRIFNGSILCGEV